VLICGDLTHYGLVRELVQFRDLWRGAFTAVEVPSLHNLSLPRTTGNRKDFDNECAQCLVMNVWPDRVIFERLDAHLGRKIAASWESQIPTYERVQTNFVR